MRPTNNLLEAALAYEKRGFSVIPVGKNKKALIKWEPYQHKRATIEEIERWWTESPKANIGLVTGKISNLLVVDADTATAAIMINDAIPEGLEVPCELTPRGGRHFIFAHQEGFINRARVIEGIDIRTTGGYVVVAPSTNGSGSGWTWLEGLSLFDTTPPPVPERLAYLLLNNTYAWIMFCSMGLSSRRIS